MKFVKAAKQNKEGNKGKHLTIILFRDIEAPPRSYKIPKRLLTAAIAVSSIFSIIFFIFLTIFTHKYLDANRKLVIFNELKRETIKQKLQIELFAKMVKDFKAKIVNLENFDKRLRTIISFKGSDAPAKVSTKTENWAVGGPDKNSRERLSDLIERDSNIALEKLFSDFGQLEQDAYSQILSFAELDQFFKEQSTLLSSIPTIWPVKGWITSGFGYRRSPFTNMREAHEGIDIATNSGALIMSPADGIVIRENTEDGYGKLLEIDHGYGFVTLFGHNSKHMVTVGDKVKRGQVIAAVGSTGRSTGPHLHYEIVLNGVPVNPSKYILEEN